MRACVASVPVLLALLAVDACNKEKVGVVEGPPLKIATASASATANATATPSRAPSINPVTAKFVDLSTRGTELHFVACEQITVALVRGKASAFGEQLAPGDVLVARAAGTTSLKGEGLAVLATVQPPQCEPGGVTKLVKKVAASQAPELTWAAGAMHARLDLDPASQPDVSANAYLGRLEGTAAVAEHVHADSWEILCAVEARGSLVLDGKEERLGAKQIVIVPPNTKHQWKPDEGSNLVAVQLYAPPGPEQRFKKLAVAVADAGRR